MAAPKRKSISQETADETAAPFNEEDALIALHSKDIDKETLLSQPEVDAVMAVGVQVGGSTPTDFIVPSGMTTYSSTSTSARIIKRVDVKGPTNRAGLLGEYPRLMPGDSHGKMIELRRLLGGYSDSQVYDDAMAKLATAKVNASRGQPLGDPLAAPAPFNQEDWAYILPEMFQGDQGPTVGVMQRFLKIEDHNRFDVDTTAAVADFRQANGLGDSARWDRECWLLAFGVTQ